MKKMKCIPHAILILIVATLPLAAAASNLPVPRGDVILTVTGKIQMADHGAVASFDMPMLEHLPRHVVRTINPWQANISAYEGVLLRDLLVALRSNGTVMRVHALDDYHEDIDVADAQSIDVILAYKRDGRYLPIRDKGPLFVVFPFSDDPSLMNAKRQDQSVWQVDRIEIK